MSERAPVEAVGRSLSDRIADAMWGAYALRPDAIHRIVGTLGGTERVSMRQKPGVLSTDYEVCVDGEPVWRAEWVQTGEYVYEQRARWLVDVERYARGST